MCLIALMKIEEIKLILAQQFKTQDSLELNKILKTDAALKIKFALRGKKLGHFGFTAPLKAITADGLKIIDGNRARLIKFSDIESFKKAEPREKRPTAAKAAPVAATPLVKKPAKDKAAAKDGAAVKPQKVSQSRFIPPSKSR
jgi:hypothetical protein